MSYLQQDRKFDRVRFGDFLIESVGRKDLVDWCLEDLAQPNIQTKAVFDVNGHGLSLARCDASYRKMIQQADVVHADGGFIVTLSKLLSRSPIPDRSATTDMIHDFAKAFEESGNSFFLLGGAEEVNAQCADELLRLYPNLKIVGRHHGFFTIDEEPALIKKVNATSPDVIWLGLGKPKEQAFALRYKQALNATWIITAGGCFNYITGHYKRAPKWMQKCNLEWLHRMITNPKQLFVRYLVTTPHALWIAFSDHG